MGCLPMLKLKVMKTFDDLKFTKHRVTKKAIMASLELKPNVLISVVAGEGMYSTSRKVLELSLIHISEPTRPY